MASTSNVCYILEQPPKILELILAYCTYDEIARVRVVCKEFDMVCQSLLNRGFIAVDRYHDKCLKKVKTQLPRRESERRNHPLARHCDILTAVETRLSLLGMTFTKYIDNNLCCFIPGKVIDEIYRVLRYVENTTTPRRSHEILQELRDISSMAMEHFDEKIVPTLKDKMASSPLALSPHGSFSLSGHTILLGPPRSAQWIPGMRHEVNKFQQNVKQTSGIVNVIRKGLADHKTKISELTKKVDEQEKQIEEQNRLLSEQHNKIADQESRLNEMGRKLLEYEQCEEQTRLLSEQHSKIADQESRLSEMNRKLLEYDQKFADMMSEFVRCREPTCHLASASSFENGSASKAASLLSLPALENEDSNLSIKEPKIKSPDVVEETVPPESPPPQKNTRKRKGDAGVGKKKSKKSKS